MGGVSIQGAGAVPIKESTAPPPRCTEPSLRGRILRSISPSRCAEPSRSALSAEPSLCCLRVLVAAPRGRLGPAPCRPASAVRARLRSSLVSSLRGDVAAQVLSCAARGPVLCHAAARCSGAPKPS